MASAVAPNKIAVHSIGRNGRTTANRSTRCARHSASGSAPGGGTTSVMLATAVRSSARETTASIASQTSSSVIFGPQSGPPAAPRPRRPASRRPADPWIPARLLSLVWRWARASSSLVISTSNSSTASSVALAAVARPWPAASPAAGTRGGGARPGPCQTSRSGPTRSPVGLGPHRVQPGHADRGELADPVHRRPHRPPRHPGRARRNRSRSEVRAPSGISSSSSNACACAAVSGAARVSPSRCIAASRTRATNGPGWTPRAAAPGVPEARPPPRRTGPSGRPR